MKNLLITFFTILLVGCIQSPKTEKNESLKIMSFNMAFCRDTIDLKIWEARKDIIMPVLKTYDVDICASQEPYAFQIKYLANQTQEYDFVGELLGDETPDKYASRPDKYHKRHLVLQNMNNPIWYKKDKFEVLESGKFWYSKTPEKQSGAWEEDRWDGERTCVWAKFRQKDNGRQFYIFNSHWLVARNTEDIESVNSAKLLLTKIKEIAKDSTFFVTGDFNATDAHQSIKHLKASGILKSAKDSAITGDFKAKTTFVGFYGDSKYENIIDHIFTSKNVSIESFLIGGTYRTLPDGKKIYPSDHLPIVIKADF